MKKLTVFLALCVVSLSALGQADQIINSSINSFVPTDGEAFLGFIIVPQDSNSDVDVVILAEGVDGFDPIVEVFFDSTDGNPVAVNDDWENTNTPVNEFDFPDNNTTTNARNCWANNFGNRLQLRDSMVLVSATAPNGSRAIFTRVTEFDGDAGSVNLQLLQVDGPLTGTCPDF